MAGAADHQAGRANAGEEWRVPMPPGGAALEHESARGAGRHACSLCCTPAWPRLLPCRAAAAAWGRVAGFGRMVRKIGADDPRRVAHGFKMALALTLCSVFYYVRPLYDFTGGRTMWALLTVIFIFEYTVGGSFSKGLNRAGATLTGGALALGVQWVADKSGKDLEPVVLTVALFLFAAVATYSRFIPKIKARFDYGVTIFIITYTLVSVSGYRADEMVSMAQHRLVTVALGAIICFAVCTFVFPVWAGQELHVQVARNMDKLAAALESCIEDYFSEAAGERRAPSEKSLGYRAVLNAKASEDSLANLARWEPPHGKFGFRHPYALYQKVGAAMRSCAYCVDALTAGVGSGAQAPAHVRKHLAGACAALSRRCAAVLREASSSVASMRRSDSLAVVVGDMNAAAQELRDELRCLSAVPEDDEPSSDTEHDQKNATAAPLIEALPLFTAASLLLEICTRAEGVVGTVDTLATAAKFEKAGHGEENALVVEAPLPVAMSATLAADVPQERQGKVAIGQEKAAEAMGVHTSKQEKVLMRRWNTMKWPRREPKVCPEPPPELAAGPKSWSVEFTGHAPSPRHWSVEFTSHCPAVPRSRNRSMDFANLGPVLPSPRNRPIIGMACLKKPFTCGEP